MTAVDTAIPIRKISVNTDGENCPVRRCLSFSMAAGMQKYMHPQADVELQEIQG